MSDTMSGNIGDVAGVNYLAQAPDAWGRFWDDPNYGIAPIAPPPPDDTSTSTTTTTSTSTPTSTTTVTATPTDTGGSDPVVPAGATPWAPATDARTTINAALETYGLGSLGTFLYDIYAKQEVDINNSDALMFALREQPAYVKRFSANAARLKKGLSELSPGTYVGLENSYRKQFKDNGFPAGFFDSTEDFASLIENDISVNELQDRIVNTFNEIDQADPEVRRQIRLLYPDSGVGDTRESLAMFALDPKTAAPILQRRAKAAKVGSRAFGSGGIQLQSQMAEDLVARGYSEGQVQQAFSEFGLQKGLLDEMSGEQSLTQDQKVGATFGYDTEAQKKLAKRREARTAVFQSGGRGTATSGATSGTTETGFGVAQ